MSTATDFLGRVVLHVTEDAERRDEKATLRAFRVDEHVAPYFLPLIWSSAFFHPELYASLSSRFFCMPESLHVVMLVNNSMPWILIHL
jgi:hypothetical protein